MSALEPEVQEFVGVVYALAEEWLVLASSWRVGVSPGPFGSEVRLRVFVPGGRWLEASFTPEGILNDGAVMARRVVEQLAVEVERIVRDRARERR